MFDRALRPWIDPPLNRMARRLARHGIGADQITVAGFAVGLSAALAVALGAFGTALVLVAVNRLADGLDGAVARLSGPTDRGGFLDITLDFAFYAAVPLAFAVHDPSRNALAACTLLAAFLVNGSAFLAFALMAAKRGLTTAAQGHKSIYYLAGLAEGAETIAVFIACCLWPQAFAIIAYTFAAICVTSAVARLAVGWRTFGPRAESD
jgi:phosphatidylglycerophosphate synthase